MLATNPGALLLRINEVLAAVVLKAYGIATGFVQLPALITDLKTS
jgi:hypothetical protein